MSDREIFYVFVPLFDWVALYLIFAVAKWFVMWKIIKNDLSHNRMKDQIFIYLATICISVGAAWFISFSYHHHMYGYNYHLLKVTLMLGVPAIVGAYEGFRKVGEMTSDEKTKFEYMTRDKDSSW